MANEKYFHVFADVMLVYNTVYALWYIKNRRLKSLFFQNFIQFN